MADEYAVETANAGASLTVPKQAGHIKKGGYLMIKGRPCKVDNMTTAKPGKHGSCKCHFFATDIFTGKKLEEISPSHNMIDTPNVNRVKWFLSDIDDGYLSLLSEDTTESKEDLKVPDDAVGDKIREMHDKEIPLYVIILSACGEEKVVDVEEDKSS